MAPPYELISAVSSLEAFLDEISSYSSSESGSPILFVDLEGQRLCRFGTLSLITIFIEAMQKVYFIDVTTLGRAAFNTAGSKGLKLKQILEAENITKVFYDVRNDSDALYSLHGVSLAGVEDLQLMEIARRPSHRAYLCGLAKCISYDGNLSYSEKSSWDQVKDKGLHLFAPEHGGSYAVFDERPLQPLIAEYCAQDVTFLPRLRRAYRAQLCDAWWAKIIAETRARIVESQSANYVPNGRHKAVPPPGWSFWHPSTSEQSSREFLKKP